MGKATQKERLLAIATNLPFDTFLIDQFYCEEALSELFRIHAELLVEETDEDPYAFTPIDIKEVLGQRASISIEQPDGGKRHFTGIFVHFSLMGRDQNYSRYEVDIVPHVWKLTQNVNSRIFQNMTVPEILKEVFEGYEAKFQEKRSYHKRNYCVQYQETDFDFALRLMEEEGIYFYFEHSPETERIVFRDDFQNPEDCPEKSQLGVINTEVLGPDQWESAVYDLSVDNDLTSGKFVYWDYNFQLPTKKLDAESRSVNNIGGNQQMEVYKYPGGYAHRFDGIDRSGGEDSGELNHIFADNRLTADNQALSSDVSSKKITGASDCCTLTVGYRFNLTNHPNSELNGGYILTKLIHEASQNPGYIIGTQKERKEYSNKFDCVPHGSGKPEYKPARKTPKPVISGPQTAFVVGPSGEEIFTDKYGRVKVQFHWDRHGKLDSDSSCWVRVSQSWASNKWGSMFIPRIGMEVIVQFIGGDPDQPIITGCVYNPETMPAYTLPDHKTRSGIKTNSTTGGGGFNELRFEDKKGDEQIFIHGEKNLDVRIKNDAMETILNDRHLYVKNEQIEKVDKDKHLKVGADKSEDVGGTVSLTAGRDIQEKAGTNYALDAGKEVHIKAGMNVVIEAGTMMTLKVGGNFININSGGVFIKGTMVMINSGGAAGPGSGCNPASPKDAKEADDAEAGKAVGTKTNPPPPNPATPSPLAAALWKASSGGVPFVEV